MENHCNEKYECAATSTAVALSTFLPHRVLSLEEKNRGRKVVLNDYTACLQEGKPGFQVNSTSETPQHQEADERDGPLSV